ncbi:DNA polymerase/3'-5' exonuclease PolX [Limnochorda pilosa]|uniref:DNA polymerase beta n=1 Tax=Limnochorda pilosa TaxID=1555112 RepID=A0A0K2SMJ6_LIMPI|nr:DNA polymerase/3'-5' exonuclease PolX [Limnochorda pilosa]BAS28330.1 DNA polymerase III [Limnochorda pilosa]
MQNLRLASIFREMADLLEVKGESVFKVRAYRRAAEQLEQLPEDLADVVRSGGIERLPGFGQALVAKAREFVATGRVEAHQRLLAEYPAQVLDLLKVPGLGPRLAERLHRELGVGGLDDLEQAARDGRLRTLRGMGPRAEEKILAGIEALRRQGARRSIGEVLPQARWLQAGLERLPAVERAVVAGSLRRWKETVKDADLVVVTSTPAELVASLRAQGLAQEVGGGEDRVAVVLPTGLKADLRLVEAVHFPSALHHFTGSKEHHVLLRERARRMGLSVSEYGLARDGGTPDPLASEEELYGRLGLAFVPPELREGHEELELAEQGALPVLLGRDDLKGDLHVHTDWSDGRASLEQMVEAARARGYRYLAVCDHSPAVRVAGGLSPERLLAQIERIERLNRTLEGFRVLVGTECDILADGTLDYPDELLERLDWVVASIHSRMGQDAETLLARYRRALESPWVDAVGHPTGRLLGRRDAMEVPVEGLVELAARRGAALEINASPERLDLDSRWARVAAQAGVRLVVSTDAHHPEHLDFIEYGVGIARRAGLGPAQVVNAWDEKELLGWIRARREAARRPPPA